MPSSSASSLSLFSPYSLRLRIRALMAGVAMMAPLPTTTRLTPAAAAILMMI